MNEILSIGTVVTLTNQDETQEFMIISRFPLINKNGTLGYYDYSAVLYPFGQFDQNNVFFNTTQIKDIIFLGYESEAEKVLKTDLENQRNEITYPHFED